MSASLLADALKQRGRDRWPVAAPGPLTRGPDGLEIPDKVRREDARAMLNQLEDTARLRELTKRERFAHRTLRRSPGVHQPTATHEFRAIAQSRIRRLSKAGKRARAAQRTMAGQRAAAETFALASRAAPVDDREPREEVQEARDE